MTSELMCETVELIAPACLEERLRIIRQRCHLLADLFTLQAEAAYVACRVEFSVDAFAALEELTRGAADDLQEIMRDIPGTIATWRPEGPEETD